MLVDIIVFNCLILVYHCCLKSDVLWRLVYYFKVEIGVGVQLYGFFIVQIVQSAHIHPYYIVVSAKLPLFLHNVKLQRGNWEFAQVHFSIFTWALPNICSYILVYIYGYRTGTKKIFLRAIWLHSGMVTTTLPTTNHNQLLNF